MEAPYTVVYDGACAICTRAAARLRSWSGASLDVVAFQEPGVRTRFPWISLHEFETGLQLVGRDGTTWAGAAALEQLLEVLPRGRLISWLFRIPFVRPLAERLYRWIARNRYRLGCGDHCSHRAET